VKIVEGDVGQRAADDAASQGRADDGCSWRRSILNASNGGLSELKKDPHRANRFLPSGSSRAREKSRAVYSGSAAWIGRN
jgi:hypothetical protein